METVKDFPRRKITEVHSIPDGQLQGEAVTLSVIIERLTALRDCHAPEAYLQVIPDHDNDDVTFAVVDFRDETDEEYHGRAQDKLKRDQRIAEARENARALAKSRMEDPPLLKVSPRRVKKPSQYAW